MLSALIVLSGGWFLLLLTTLALPLTMDGVWWRPEPCRCLGADASVPVPACSLIAGLVRVVSAAFCLGSSDFLVTSGFPSFFAVASVALSVVSLDIDGCRHTVVVLQLHFVVNVHS